MEASAEPAISIYVPVSGVGPEANSGRILLKNFSAIAESRLVEQGMRHTLALDLLAPLRELDEDKVFWNSRAGSLAIFLASNFLEVYRLPFDVPESVTVGHGFFLRPVLHVLNQADNYCILALERNDVRVLQCSSHGIMEVKVESMPTNYEGYFAEEFADKQQQSHTAGPVGRAGNVIRHGAGDRGVDEKERLHRFCQAVSRAIEHDQTLANEPFVIVGTKEVQDIFRSVSKLRHVVAEGSTRTPKMLSPVELFELTSPIMAEYQDKPRQAAIEHYKEVAGTGYTSQQIEDIVAAAFQGKVDALFADTKTGLWGNFQPESAKAAVHGGEVVGDDELINLAAIATIRNGGRVYDVTPEEVQLSSPIAAVYRY